MMLGSDDDAQLGNTYLGNGPIEKIISVVTGLWSNRRYYIGRRGRYVR